MPESKSCHFGDGKSSTFCVIFEVVSIFFLGDWETLNWIIQNDPVLKKLRMGLNNYKAESIQNLPDIKTVFSTGNMGCYSAETRVASIALLYHLCHSNIPGYSTASVETARFLCSGNEGLFLFDHEKALLSKIF